MSLDDEIAREAAAKHDRQIDKKLDKKLEYILSSLRRAMDENLSWPVYPGEAACLVEEVERLRAEVARLRGESAGEGEA